MIKICNLWSNEQVKWKESNWTWNECQLVEEICKKWNDAHWLWSKADWKWSKCTGSIPPIPPIPVVSIANPPGVDATTLIQPWMEEQIWNPYKNESLDKRKRLIRLICKVQGKEYNEEKEIGDYKITVGDVRMTVKSVSNIDLDLKLEE